MRQGRITNRSTPGPAALSALGFLGFAAVMAFLQRVPAWIPLIYAGVSLITLVLYAVDKAKAARGEWRTPESTLHLLEIAGGWPGALVAQQVLRHKNRKEKFQSVFWGIVILHLALWLWVAIANPFGMSSTEGIKQKRVPAVAVPASRGRAAERHP